MSFWERKMAEKLGRPVPAPGVPQPRTSYPPVQPAPPPAYVQQGPDTPDGQMRVGDAIHLWKGGQAARTETERCPACGSGNFFSRNNGTIRGHPPASHCYDCGYPLVQFSSELGAGGLGGQ